MKREVLRSIGWALLVTGILVALIVVGSRNLAHFDAALVGYLFGTLFAAFAIAYRYAKWLQRPPTAEARPPPHARSLSPPPPRRTR